MREDEPPGGEANAVREPARPTGKGGARRAHRARGGAERREGVEREEEAGTGRETCARRRGEEKRERPEASVASIRPGRARRSASGRPPEARQGPRGPRTPRVAPALRLSSSPVIRPDDVDVLRGTDRSRRPRGPARGRPPRRRELRRARGEAGRLVASSPRVNDDERGRRGRAPRPSAGSPPRNARATARAKPAGEAPRTAWRATRNSHGRNAAVSEVVVTGARERKAPPAVEDRRARERARARRAERR